MLVIGSQALRYQLSKIGKALPPRKGRADLDILASRAEAYNLAVTTGLLPVSANDVNQSKALYKAPDGTMVEFDFVKLGTSNHYYQMYADQFRTLDTVPFFGVELPMAPLEVLYSIKRGHRHSPKKFHKHVVDYNLLRSILNTDTLDKITSLRYRETVAREKLKTPSLAKKSDEFFDDSVSNKTFVHDQIHDVMAFGPRPMFEQILIDPGNSVACSREKFDNLGYVNQIRCVQEEAYVIALERAIIPMLFAGGPIARPEDAYRWAIMRICTTLTSGWFREFAVENYDDLIYFYNPSYVNKFLNAVESGTIVRIK